MHSKAFKTSFRVAWADTDAAQVVHYLNYFRFFERTEEEFYRHLGFNFADLAASGTWFPRVEAFCKYVKSVRFNDLVEVELTIEELKERSVKYHFKVTNKETVELLADGHVVVVAVDKQKGKATQIPKETIDKLRAFCE